MSKEKQQILKLISEMVDIEDLQSIAMKIADRIEDVELNIRDEKMCPKNTGGARTERIRNVSTVKNVDKGGAK